MPTPVTGQDFVGATIASEMHPGVEYRVERLLGEGGTAGAYLAVRACCQGQAPAVMKIILPEIATESGGTAATVVKKEAVALGRLNERVPPTPFVVRFMDVGTVPFRYRGRLVDLPWLAVEYVHGGVEGTTLDERIRFAVERTGYAFDRERASRVISHVSQGLSEVHAVGVVHRDLTPNNVLCCGFGAGELFKISDFGIARPQGLEATFGTALVGTPGYIAPEQGLETDAAGPVADIFSLGAIAFNVLTGEDYFNTPNPIQALMMAKAEARRSITECPRLCPELRADSDACRAIDEALARATAGDPPVRPQNAKAFAASVLPWVTGREAPRPSRRHITSVLQAQPEPGAHGWNWTVRHPPGDDRVVRSVGWDGDGHCLAATSRGLAYWDGTEWLEVPPPSTAVPAQVRFVRRIDSGRWLLAGEGARLVEYSREGVTRVLRGPDEQVVFTHVGGSVDDLAVVVGEQRDCPPLLYAYVGGYWLRALPASDAATVTGITRVEETRWLVAGRSTEGKGYAAIYSPLQWEIERVAAPDTRALVACAGLAERHSAVAVGGQGAVLHVSAAGVKPRRLETHANLAAAAVDLLDRTWAGGAGQLWVSTGEGKGWMQIWRDDSWQAPFVSIHADAGMVVAMTADGAVLECRIEEKSLTAPPGPTIV